MSTRGEINRHTLPGAILCTPFEMVYHIVSFLSDSSARMKGPIYLSLRLLSAHEGHHLRIFNQLRVVRAEPTLELLLLRGEFTKGRHNTWEEKGRWRGVSQKRSNEVPSYKYMYGMTHITDPLLVETRTSCHFFHYNQYHITAIQYTAHGFTALEVTSCFPSPIDTCGYQCGHRKPRVHTDGPRDAKVGAELYTEHNEVDDGF